MKLNFRKIASVLASTVMLGSTVAMAAAANVPSPFVQNGNGDALIVYGTNPLMSQEDVVAATNIKAFLDNKVSGTTGTSTTSESATVTGGDNTPLYKDNSRLNLGENLNSVYTTLDDDELSTVLADGIYVDEDGTEYDYTQKISLNAIPLTLFADSDVDEDEKPVIGFDIPSNTNVFNYTLSFSDPVVNTTAVMATSTLEMLGREYYISSVDASGALKLTLLDTANSVIVAEGETASVTVGDKTFEVAIVGVEDSDTAVLSVDGVKLNSMNEGNSRKIPGTNSYIGLKDVIYNSKDTGVSSVEVSIGTGQIVIQDGNEVKINDDTVNGLTADTTSNSAGKLTEIKLVWTPDEEQYLVPGMDLVLPGFEAIKLSMPGFVTDEDETLTVKNNGDDYMEVRNVKVKDGEVSSFPLIYANSTKTGFAGLGKDSTHVLLTSTGNTLSLDDSTHPKFVATYQSGDNSESYAFELISVNRDSDTENKTTIRNMATGEDLVFTNNDDETVGELELAVSAQNGVAGTATLTVTHSGSSSGVYLDRVVTEKGLAFRLPVIVNTAADADGELNANATSNPTTWSMNFTEGDEDNNNFGINAGGVSFWAKMAFTGTGTPAKIEVDSTSLTMLETESGSDDQVAYVSGSGSHATKLLLKDADQDYLEVTYHGVEAYADVYVAESSAVISGGNGTVSETGIMLAKDTEVTATTAKNMVVVGGSCVNKIAAELLGLTYGADTSCGSAWESKTNVGAGSYLIKSFARNGKIATLVAGYNAGDTTNAATAFRTQSIDTTAGKAYTGTTGNTVSPVVTTP